MANKKYFLIFFLFIFFSKICYSQEILFKGLNKLDVNDLETLTDIDFTNKKISDSEVSLLIKDLYKSDLIYDISVINETSQVLISP